LLSWSSSHRYGSTTVVFPYVSLTLSTHVFGGHPGVVCVLNRKGLAITNPSASAALLHTPTPLGQLIFVHPCVVFIDPFRSLSVAL
jgi:hypothetical protein